MAQALCRNEDCGHEWRLQKPPGEYKQGIRCPKCGTTRVEVEHENHEQPPQQQQTRQAPQQQETQLASRQEETGGLPASETAMAAGMEAGNLLANFNSDDPSKRAAATGRGLKAVGSLLAQYGDHQEQQALERNERAKQASNDDIQVADQYPTCPGCDYQLRDLPEVGKEFSCPNCGMALVHEP